MTQEKLGSNLGVVLPSTCDSVEFQDRPPPRAPLPSLDPIILSHLTLGVRINVGAFYRNLASVAVNRFSCLTFYDKFLCFLIPIRFAKITLQ